MVTTLIKTTGGVYNTRYFFHLMSEIQVEILYGSRFFSLRKRDHYNITQSQANADLKVPGIAMISMQIFQSP